MQLCRATLAFLLTLTSLFIKPVHAQSIFGFDTIPLTITGDSGQGFYFLQATDPRLHRGFRPCFGRRFSPEGGGWDKYYSADAGLVEEATSFNVKTGPGQRVMVLVGRQVVNHSHQYFSQASSGGYLLVADTAGRIAWARGLKSDSLCELRDAAVTPTGEVYMVGNLRSYQGFQDGCHYLAKLSVAGDLLWSVSIKDQYERGEDELCQVFLEDGGNVRILMSTLLFTNTGGAYTVLHSLLFSAAGTLIDSKSHRYGELTVLRRAWKSKRYYYVYSFNNAGAGTTEISRFRVGTGAYQKSLSLTNFFDDNYIPNHRYDFEPDAKDGFMVGMAGNTHVGLIRYDSAMRHQYSYRYGRCRNYLLGVMSSEKILAPMRDGSIALVSQDAFVGELLIPSPTGQLCKFARPAAAPVGNLNTLPQFWQPGTVRVKLKPMQLVRYTVREEPLKILPAMPLLCTPIFRNQDWLPASVSSCSDTAVVLNTLGDIRFNHFLWSTGDTTRAISVHESGMYTVYQSGRCGYTTTYDTVPVTIGQAAQPFTVVPGQATLCPGDSVSLAIPTAQPGGMPYKWPMVPGLTVVGNNLSIYHAPDSLYSPLDQAIAVTAGVEGCQPKTASATVHVWPTPTGQITAGTTDSTFHIQVAYGILERVIVTGGTFVKFSAATGMLTVHWDRSQADHSLRVELANNGNCKGEANLAINLGVPGAEEVVGNVITPNNDGTNDHFGIRNASILKTYHLTVMNRWGKPEFGGVWSPTAWPARNQAPGQYFYRLTSNGRVWKGWVEVVK